MTEIFAVFVRSGATRMRGWAALAAALACLAATPAAAQTAGRPTVPASATAIVLTPLTIIDTQAMDFGRIAPRATVGTVILNPASNTCTTTGGLLRIGPCQAAEFVGRGTFLGTVRVRVNENSINLTGPGAPMRLDAFTADFNGLLYLGSPGNPRYLILATSGLFTYRVGGTLRINANQAPGRYSGTFTVRADYL